MKVRIFDTTLRDGEQTPGVALKPQDKIAIAKKLDNLGVDSIEAGFPIISEGEKNAIKGIVAEGLKANVYGLARAEKKDIDAAADVGLKHVHTFIATSDIHLEYKLRITRETALEKAIEAVEYAKGRGLKVEFSAEDATRTDREFLKQIFRAVAMAGADTIDIPDTVGYATPVYIATITKDAIGATGLPISVHCHNDFGLAVANALSGIGAGATCAHVTINGIGERAGNASLEELTMALNSLDFGKKYSTSINTKLIYETSQLVSQLTGIRPQPNKAIIGDNAFAHESGIHTHGILSNPLTYEAIRPESVGRVSSIKAGKHAGVHGVLAMLKEYGIAPDKKQAHAILEQVKAIGDKGNEVGDEELLAVAGKVMGISSLRQFVTLEGFSVSTGIGNMPYAFVKIGIDEHSVIGTDYGKGPVDASLRAIQNAVGKKYYVKLNDYRLASVAGGSDSICQVTISVEDKHANRSEAKARGEDIVITSVKAMINGINRLMLKEMINKSGLQG